MPTHNELFICIRLGAVNVRGAFAQATNRDGPVCNMGAQTKKNVTHSRRLVGPLPPQTPRRGDLLGGPLPLQRSEQATQCLVRLAVL